MVLGSLTSSSDSPTHQTLHQFMTLTPSLAFIKIREVSKKHLLREWHASKERFSFQTPDYVPFCDLYMFFNVETIFQNLLWIFLISSSNFLRYFLNLTWLCIPQYLFDFDSYTDYYVSFSEFRNKGYLCFLKLNGFQKKNVRVFPCVSIFFHIILWNQLELVFTAHAVFVFFSVNYPLVVEFRLPMTSVKDLYPLHKNCLLPMWACWSCMYVSAYFQNKTSSCQEMRVYNPIDLDGCSDFRLMRYRVSCLFSEECKAPGKQTYDIDAQVKVYRKIVQRFSRSFNIKEEGSKEGNRLF